VYCNDFRHPVVLAKEAATLDLLSDGRLELGIGAGWMTTDYSEAGLDLDRPGVRIDRMDEAVTVVKNLLTGGVVDHDGPHYRLHGLRGAPRAVQTPHPPILIGGGGRRMLTVAARQADIVGLNIDMRAGYIGTPSGATATAAATREKIGWIRDAAGDRFDDLEIQVRIHLAQITDDRQALAAETSPFFGLSATEGLLTPHALGGSVAEVVEQCEARREAFGISYIGLSADVMDAMAPVVARLAGR
jgi:probable F420-dependent oxidoreductase